MKRLIPIFLVAAVACSPETSNQLPIFGIEKSIDINSLEHSLKSEYPDNNVYQEGPRRVVMRGEFMGNRTQTRFIYPNGKDQLTNFSCMLYSDNGFTEMLSDLTDMHGDYKMTVNDESYKKYIWEKADVFIMIDYNVEKREVHIMYTSS